MTLPSSRPPPAHRVLALFGPTASGKSVVAEAIAERSGAELVNADAMQLYRGLPILTNQSPYPTHLVGIWDLAHEGSVAEYARLAHAVVDDVLERGRTPLLVGGTGLYLRAALAALHVPPRPPAALRARLDAFYAVAGPIAAHAELERRDPTAAARVHPNDRRRVVRALELSELGSSLRPDDDRLWAADARHPTLVFGLDVPPDELRRRIEARTSEMFEAGVDDEVRRALAGPMSATARKILGLEEVASLPRDAAVAALVTRTRRYAAYQRKWMRRIPGLVSVRADRPAAEVAGEILEVARARQHVPARRAG